MTDINQFIKDTTTASFTEDVIEASSHSLVIVDFLGAMVWTLQAIDTNT